MPQPGQKLNPSSLKTQNEKCDPCSGCILEKAIRAKTQNINSKYLENNLATFIF